LRIIKPSLEIIIKEDQRTKALEHSEKFLNLWKDADPGIAEVETLREDASERLAGLKGQ
jgi:hypothetical protein